MVDGANFNPLRRHTISRSEWSRPHYIVTYATRINGQRVVIRFDSSPEYYDEFVWGVALQVDMSRRQKKSLRQHYSFHIENSTGKGTGRSGLDFLLWAVRKMDEFQQTYPGSSLYLGGADDRRERAYAAVQRYGFRPNIVDEHGGYWRTADDFIAWQRKKQIRQSPTDWTLRCLHDKAKLISIFGEEYVNTQIPTQERLAKKVKNTIALSERELWQRWSLPFSDSSISATLHRDARIVILTNLWWRTITTQPNETERRKAFTLQSDYGAFAWSFLWNVSYIHDRIREYEEATKRESYLYLRFLFIKYTLGQGYTARSIIWLHGNSTEDIVGVIDLATCADEEAAKRTLAHIDWGVLNRIVAAKKAQRDVT